MARKDCLPPLCNYATSRRTVAVEVQEIVGVRGQRVRRAITGAQVPEEPCNLRDRLLPVIQEIKRDAPILLPSANSHAPPSPLVHLF